MDKKFSFPKQKMRILLLEGIHPVAADVFREAGYSAEIVQTALSEDELVRELPSIHVLGIRSKTELTARALDAGKHLLTAGCFCIGTNQVNLATAATGGIPIFNAPFSNTRSVAELVIAEIIMLARKAAHKSQLLHSGQWEKSANNCWEVRHKTIGIIGYGHIGPQVGVLAEALGMKVLVYDITQKLPMGNARQVASLDELLQNSDFVTLHVPETAQTKNMIGEAQLARMKRGSFLLNLSRGTVVEISALRQALLSGHIEGAAVDVFPVEPKGNISPFESELCGLPNVILTPHIGGSTNEAQYNIGIEVSTSLVKYVETGTTSGAVNFPQVELPMVTESHRVLNIHRNVPGVLSRINSIVAEMGVNIKAQYLRTLDDVGYLIMDIDRNLSSAMKEKIESLDTSIRTRLLF